MNEGKGKTYLSWFSHIQIEWSPKVLLSYQQNMKLKLRMINEVEINTHPLQLFCQVHILNLTWKQNKIYYLTIFQYDQIQYLGLNQYDLLESFHIRQFHNPRPAKNNLSCMKIKYNLGRCTYYLPLKHIYYIFQRLIINIG